MCTIASLYFGNLCSESAQYWTNNAVSLSYKIYNQFIWWRNWGLKQWIPPAGRNKKCKIIKLWRKRKLKEHCHVSNSVFATTDRWDHKTSARILKWGFAWKWTAGMGITSVRPPTPRNHTSTQQRNPPLLNFLWQKHVESWIPYQGSNPCPLQWRCWAFTTGLLKMSLGWVSEGKILKIVFEYLPVCCFI